MSFSFQLAHSCPHMIMGEVVTLSADDKRSMFLRGPVANNQSVLVSANGIYVPPTGYHSLPSVSTATGPFKIQNCVGTSGGGNEALTVTTLSGSVALSLPVGPRVSLAKVKRTLVLGASGLFSVSEKHGTLVLTGLGETGSKSYIQVSGKGAASLGFSQLKSRGREVYPPWSLNARPNQLPTWGGTGIVQQNRAMYPRFSKPLRGSPILKVTYATTGGQCPRCQGTLIENDYRFNALGNLMVVANEDLLYQACLKAILTNKGSNPYSPAYGTMIQGRIGMKAARAGASLVQEDIMNVLQGVQATQANQKEYQNVGLREMLYKVLSVSVQSSPSDPTIMTCSVVVSNMSNKPISLNITFSVPGVVALAGSNGKSLGLEAAGL